MRAFRGPARLLPLLLLLTPSCGTRSTNGNGESAGAHTTTTIPPSPEPLGELVRPGDPLIQALRPQLAEWEKRWREVLPEFSLDSLRRAPSRPFRYAYTRPATGRDRERARFFGRVSPDSTRIVEPDMYRVLPDSAGEVSGEPDSAPAILDLRADSLRVLTVIGTLGGFEEAFWLDRDRAIVIGYGERQYQPWMGGGDLSVYDLRAGTLTMLRGPSVDQKVFGKYLQLSLADQKRRFGKTRA